MSRMNIIWFVTLAILVIFPKVMSNIQMPLALVESFDRSFSAIRWKSSDRTSMFNAPSMCSSAYS